MKLRIFPTIDELARAAADQFVEIAQSSITARGRCTVALAGGTTPKSTYQLLATEPYASSIDWSRVFVFWGDERCVPPDDSSSNFRMAREALLDYVPIPASNVQRMHGEDEPAAAAVAYERELDRAVGDRFDLIHLGMGDDGHTASLFPGGTAIQEKTKRAVAEFVQAVDMWRITLTPRTINSARNVVFIVAGASKANTVARVLEGPRAPDLLPAQSVAPNDGELFWLLDADAAVELRDHYR